MLFTCDNSSKAVIQTHDIVFVILILMVALSKKTAQRIVVEVKRDRKVTIHGNLRSVAAAQGSGSCCYVGHRAASSARRVWRTQVVSRLEQAAETSFIIIVVIVVFC